jgi:hypothetical protein
MPYPKVTVEEVEDEDYLSSRSQYSSKTIMGKGKGKSRAEYTRITKKYTWATAKRPSLGIPIDKVQHSVHKKRQAGSTKSSKCNSQCRSLHTPARFSAGGYLELRHGQGAGSPG